MFSKEQNETNSMGLDTATISAIFLTKCCLNCFLDIVESYNTQADMYALPSNAAIFVPNCYIHAVC